MGSLTPLLKPLKVSAGLFEHVASEKQTLFNAES